MHAPPPPAHQAEFERDMVEQLFADLTALRDSFNVYLEQLGGLQGTDAEEVSVARGTWRANVWAFV